MEFDLWSKTLLRSYGMLEKITGAIDRTFNKIAYTSRSSSTSDTLLSSTYQISEKLLTLIDRKRLLINTKILVDEILSSIDENSAKVLVLKYINNLTNDDMTKILNLSIRTILRRTNKAVEEFGYEIKCRGYTEEKLNNMYMNEKWVMDILKSVQEENQMYLKRSENYFKNTR